MYRIVLIGGLLILVGGCAKQTPPVQQPAPNPQPAVEAAPAPAPTAEAPPPPAEPECATPADCTAKTPASQGMQWQCTDGKCLEEQAPPPVAAPEEKPAKKPAKKPIKKRS
jgi:hypothetical protein